MIRRSEVGKLAFSHEVSERTIQKDYVITRILRELGPQMAEAGLRFKGGTCLKKCYFEDYRFSEDLDFTVESGADSKGVRLLLESVAGQLSEAGLTVELPEPIVRSEGLTYVAKTAGPLGSEDKLKVDITTHELLVFEATPRRLFDMYSDAEEPVDMWCYSLEEIFLEKLLCLLDPSRTQPRDLYDLVRLSENGSVDVEVVSWGFPRKAEFKGLDPTNLRQAINRKSSQIETLWEQRLGEQLPTGSLPEYESSERSIVRLLRQHGLFD